MTESDLVQFKEATSFTYQYLLVILADFKFLKAQLQA